MLYFKEKNHCWLSVELFYRSSSYTMRFTQNLILFAVGILGSSSPPGSPGIFQHMPTYGSATPVMIGTPAQSLFMTAAFNEDHTRVFPSDNCSLFVESFNIADSSTFRYTSESPVRSADPLFGGAHRPGVDTLTFGGRVFENAAIDSVTNPDREDTMSRGLGGRLGLARGSAIAASSVLELKAEDVYASGQRTSTSGFSVSMTDAVPALAPHMTEIVAPLVPGKSGWIFKARSGVNGQMIHDSDIEFQLDPSSVGVTLPPADFHRLHAILVAANGASRAFVVGSRLALACGADGAFTVPHKYSISLPNGDVIDINTQVYLEPPQYDEQARGYLCYTIFSSAMPFVASPTTMIGRNILDNRHSVILDARSETVRFRKSAVFGPRPGVVSDAIPGLIVHSARFTMTSAGLAFPEAVPEEKCKYALSFTEARNVAGSESKMYSFSAATGSCHIATLDQALPGIYHLGNNGKAIGDPVTKQAIIPLSPSTSLDEPSYEIRVVACQTMISVVLTPVTATAYFEQLDIAEEAPVLKAASESERTPDASEEEEVDECMICRVSLAEEGTPISVVSRCGHQYHTGCIREWVKKRPICPQCTRTIPLKEGATLKKSSV